MPPQRHALQSGEELPALYMTTLTVTRCTLGICAFCRRWFAANRSKKVVLIAAKRKLLTILNTMIKAQKPWNKVHYPLLETCHPTQLLGWAFWP